MSPITIFQARRVLTMNPSRPLATHVAVRDGRILGVGALEELSGWGPYRLETRLADKVLMPGLVEGHSHLMEGAFWRFVYCGYFDRRDPNGRVWPGARTLAEVLQRLQEAQAALADPTQPLAGWGFDPIYFDNRRCVREDLDRVSTTRPVGMIHASGHIINCNSAALAAVGWLRSGIDHPGVPLGTDGLPTGELKGPEAMMQVAGVLGMDRTVLAGDKAALRLFSRLCVRAGVTTATDLASPLPDEALPMLLRTTAEDGFPTRIVPLLRLMGGPEPTILRAAALQAQGSDRLRLGRVKIVADGSIQGFSARLRWPGYYNGAPNGLWYLAPEQLQQALALALQHGVQVHVHTNGDEATDAVLDGLERALQQYPRPDHRFTLQHCQLADAAQFRRMKALGLSVNLFANHHFYWGDEHYRLTVGPERATRMNACATALASGVPLAIHSDAPITPLAPLFTAWCAVHRLTASGRTLGEHERIGVADALRAITLGAAWTLKLDGEIGSIECGKRADFCVLDDDPLALPAMQLKDLPVWGVVQDGRIFAAAELPTD
ncbi:MAG: amidohydrolase [Burkholderiales bacterium]|nr:amidohydrolase [Burkholderiales bacterium]